MLLLPVAAFGIAFPGVVGGVGENLDLAAEGLFSGQLVLNAGKGALDDATVVPGAALHRLAVLVPQRHVHVVVSAAAHRLVRKRLADLHERPRVFFCWRHCC